MMGFFMDPKEVILAKLAEPSISARDFYNDYLLSQDVWLFQQSQGYIKHDYHEFKKMMSEELGISPFNFSIAGSAKLGFSLNPSKGYRDFTLVGNSPSDLDLVIVSKRQFDNLWQSFRDLVNNYHYKKYNSLTSGIFRGFVSFKTSDLTGEQYSYFGDWVRRVESMKANLATHFYINCEVNYRVYETWEDVDRYHLQGIEKLKRNK